MRLVETYMETGSIAETARTEAQIEAAAVEAKKTPGYGRERLASYLWQEKGLVLSPHHDPPHPSPGRVHGAQDEGEDVLPRPLGRGGETAVHPRPGRREGGARQGGAGNQALGPPDEAKASPVPVDVP